MDAALATGLAVVAAYLQAEFGDVAEPKATPDGRFAFVIRDDADQTLEVTREALGAGVSLEALATLGVARAMRGITPSLEFVELSQDGIAVRPIAV